MLISIRISVYHRGGTDQAGPLDWIAKGQGYTVMSADSLHLRVDAQTAQSTRFKGLIGEFFYTEFKRVRPKYGPYEVEIRIERPEHSPVEDVENVARAVLDALTGCVFHDDSQVEKLLVEKIVSERPRVKVRARPLQRDAA
ncbi:MAG: hypothetical protein DHS20C06_12450 [Hyphobacterium sp.]|nr:MAG: hypothetical protein DHS20C06_12450 [Hyphobacterium sp.]